MSMTFKLNIAMNTGLYSLLFRKLKLALIYLHIDHLLKYTPFKFISIYDSNFIGNIQFINKGIDIREFPPIIYGHKITIRFTKYYQRKSRPIFVLDINNARILGKEGNVIIDSNGRLIKEVSREFGATGGQVTEKFRVLTHKIVLKKPIFISGTSAIISTCGSNNFHHWNFDILPRLKILTNSKYFDEIERIVLNFKGLPFQLEGLKALNLPTNKIINLNNYENTHLKFERLIIPSFTQDLSTINPFVLDFLRSTFINSNNANPKNIIKRIFLSRRNVKSRKIINEKEVVLLFKKYGFVEVLPEDYTMAEMANIVSNADAVASVHGSGLSNIAFLNKGASVLDILAPFHQDPYYWMICNHLNCKYVGLFAEGNHPNDDLDLVIENIDDNLLIDLNKLEIAIQNII